MRSKACLWPSRLTGIQQSSAATSITALRGRHGLAPVAEPFAQHNAQRQRAPTGGHVHDDAAGKIDGVDRRRGVEQAVHHTTHAP